MRDGEEDEEKSGFCDLLSVLPAGLNWSLALDGCVIVVAVVVVVVVVVPVLVLVLVPVTGIVVVFVHVLVLVLGASSRIA